MAQKQIWSGIPLFPVLVMFFISRLAETNRARFDFMEVEVESIAGYNIEYALFQNIVCYSNSLQVVELVHSEINIVITMLTLTC